MCMSVCLYVLAYCMCLCVCTYVCTVLVCVQRMGTLYTCIHPHLYIYISMYYTVTFPQHLAKLNSFNTLWAVVGAFLHFSIPDLPKAKKEVRNTSQCIIYMTFIVTNALQQKEELINMFVTSRNYTLYRSKLDDAQRKGYFLPLL